MEANDHLASRAVNVEQIVLVEPRPNDRTSQEKRKSTMKNTIHRSMLMLYEGGE